MNVNRLRVVAVCCLALGAAPLYAQRDLKDIPDPDPELQRQSFLVAEGFEVNLYAADPLLSKPIQMNFDAAGRLWVATSEVYPHIKPGQVARDKILVLEDLDRDGAADQVTVFADGLLIPTGVEPGDGGAYVANSTELLLLRDRDGDGRADEQRVLLSGFGTEDTHHILHTFRWGPDGALYFNQSIYIHSHIETPWGVRRLGGGGIWQFRPDSMRLEILCRGFVNPWGHHFDRWGTSFATDGAYGEGINYVFPGAVFVSSPGARRILAGLNPGSPKHCGLEITSGRHLPESWRGNALTNDFRGHRVCRFVLSEDGSGFASREQPELIKTNHVAFRPVDIKMGPDGAIYIADWYNPIIQHGEVDFRDPRRDHVHGRIWRVTAKGRPLVEPPRLLGVPTAQLLEALRLPEDWTRQQARRLLRERGREIEPELQRFVSRLHASGGPDVEHHLLEALWVYQAIDVVEPALLKRLLRSEDHNARAAATRVLAAWQGSIDNALQWLAELVDDPHPRVRLEAVCALAATPSAEAARVALRALDHPRDRFLDFALWNTVRSLAPFWLPAFENGQFAADDVSHLVFALQAVESASATGPLRQLLRDNAIGPEQHRAVYTLLAALGDADDLALVLERVLQPGTPPELQQPLLEALTEAATRRSVRPACSLQGIVALLDSRNVPVASAAAHLVGLWQLHPHAAALERLAAGEATPAMLRRAAVQGLGALAADGARSVLLRLALGSHPVATRLLAVEALVASDVALAAQTAAQVLPAVDAESLRQEDFDLAALFQAFLQRRGGAAALAQALRDVRLHADVAKVGLRLARSSAQPHDALVAALTTAGGITTGPKELSPEQMQRLIEQVQRQGDAARGEHVFRREDQACFKCHAIAGVGGLVGPDLTSLGTSAQLDYLIDSLLQPAKQIKENYHSVVVSTVQGQILTGIKVRQTDTALILRTAQDEEVSIPLGDIEEQAPGGSLMPVGTIDTLTEAELTDLLRFLSELGKVGPYQVSTARLVRRWEVLQATEAARYVLRRTRHATAAEERSEFTWMPAYSYVSGELPVADLPTFPFRSPFGDSQQAIPTAFVRCDVEVSTPGEVRLLLNSADGLQLWIDGQPHEVQREITVPLGRGRHRLTLAVDLAQRQQPLRLELGDVPGSAAVVQPVRGK
jgi:putative heme-binding domain-containing protein